MTVCVNRRSGTLPSLETNATPEDWCFFYSLLEGKSRSASLRLRIPDTVILLDGAPQASAYTSRDGKVSLRSTANLTPQLIERGFIASAKKERKGISRWGAQEFVLLERRATSSRGLDELGVQRIISRITSYFAKTKPGDNPDPSFPYVLQTYIPSTLQMRFVTRVWMDGETVSSHLSLIHISEPTRPY
eukprot:TRINITY_DN11618_c0_g1_i1.p1 TRINITY_DN11618_c0_g1~~TRINITY_DN11618_c0_g1_i1.p1  ORF type:complete len:189 (+),score=27.45 TRINITY_DN11618_c0_g1_i1:60-626(+)